MVDLNQFTISGNLCTDVTIKDFPSGASMADFRVACNYRTKDKNDDWKDEVVFITAKIFGSRAKPFARFHRKGVKCLLHGCFREDQWDDKKTGQKRRAAYLRVDEWILIAPKGSGGGSDSGYHGGSGNSGGTFEASNGDFGGIDNTPF